jgi:hypothetical protein
MPFGQEALRMNDQLAVAASRDNCFDGIGRLALKRAAGGNDGDAHGASLWKQTPNFRNGALQPGSA